MKKSIYVCLLVCISVLFACKSEKQSAEEIANAYLNAMVEQDKETLNELATMDSKKAIDSSLFKQSLENFSEIKVNIKDTLAWVNYKANNDSFEQFYMRKVGDKWRIVIQGRSSLFDEIDSANRLMQESIIESDSNLKALMDDDLKSEIAKKIKK